VDFHSLVVNVVSSGHLFNLEESTSVIHWTEGSMDPTAQLDEMTFKKSLFKSGNSLDLSAEIWHFTDQALV
jgi:hypothetical protein